MLTKEQIQGRTHLVRIHESNCQIEFPTPEEANFRIAIMKQLGREFGLKEIRSTTVAGPVTSTTPRQGNAAVKGR